MASTADSAAPKPTTAGAELGDLTRQIDTLRDEAAVLFAMYENDDEAYVLSAYARQISDRAARIATTLNLMGDALQNLEI